MRCSGARALFFVLAGFGAFAPVAPAAPAAPQRVALSNPLVDAAALQVDGRPGTALAEGGKGVAGRVLWVASGGGDAQVLAEGLDGLERLLALDADGDGASDTLLAGHPGGLWRVHPGPVEKILDSPGLDLRSVRPSSRVAGSTIGLLRAGRLGWWRWGGGRLEQGASVPLPTTLERTAWGLSFESPRAWVVGDRVAVGPFDRGAGRYETILVDQAGALASAWALVPAGFQVQTSYVVTLGANPVLLVQGANKVGLFVDAELLVYSLVPDPSREGHRPLARLSTPCSVWTTHELAGRLQGGAVELVAACPKGVVANELWTGAWTVGVGGRPSAPRSGDLSGEPHAFELGVDLDSDGIGDLVVLGDDATVRVHRGRAGGRPFESRALLEHGLGSTEGERQVTVTVGSSGSSVREDRATGGVVRVVDGDGAPARVVAGWADENGQVAVVLSAP